MKNSNSIYICIQSYFSHLGGFFRLEFYKYYLLIVVGTCVLVLSGFDWWYLIFVSKHIPRQLLFVSDILGFILPTFFILTLFFYNLVDKGEGRNREIKKLLNLSILTTSLSLFSAAAIKAFAGRVSPPHRGDYLTWLDNSREFQFGFMREQIFGGFPSSHATLFFTFAFVIYFLYPKQKYLHLFLFALAIFIGLGVTLGFHWFSELFAGIILGFVVAKLIKNKFHEENKS